MLLAAIPHDAISRQFSERLQHARVDQNHYPDQMKAFATLNSLREGKKIWYGVIDGGDTNRLLAAYPKKFGLK